MSISKTKQRKIGNEGMCELYSMPCSALPGSLVCMQGCCILFSLCRDAVHVRASKAPVLVCRLSPLLNAQRHSSCISSNLTASLNKEIKQARANHSKPLAGSVGRFE